MTFFSCDKSFCKTISDDVNGNDGDDYDDDVKNIDDSSVIESVSARL